MMGKFNALLPENSNATTVRNRKRIVKRRILEAIIRLEKCEFTFEQIMKFTDNDISKPAGDKFQYAIGYINETVASDEEDVLDFLVVSIVSFEFYLSLFSCLWILLFITGATEADCCIIWNK
jgi:hypothetical protein